MYAGCSHGPLSRCKKIRKHLLNHLSDQCVMGQSVSGLHGAYQSVHIYCSTFDPELKLTMGTRMSRMKCSIDFKAGLGGDFILSLRNKIPNAGPVSGWMDMD